MEFVTQILEPLGGKILRPSDWYYREGHRGPVFMWTLSEQDSSKPYMTGVRIQLFTEIMKGTGKTARQFILDIKTSKAQEASKVIETCHEEDHGLFMRTCLEVNEGPNHLRYAFFWHKSSDDIAIVAIYGTSRELWTKYLPIFDKMALFELIDVKRFE